MGIKDYLEKFCSLGINSIMKLILFTFGMLVLSFTAVAICKLYMIYYGAKKSKYAYIISHVWLNIHNNLLDIHLLRAKYKHTHMYI